MLETCVFLWVARMSLSLMAYAASNKGTSCRLRCVEQPGCDAIWPHATQGDRLFNVMLEQCFPEFLHCKGS